MLLRTKLHGKTYEFPDIRLLMGKANEEKSGDRLAGVGAETAAERVAAKLVLAEVPMWVLQENPAVPYDQDEITRVIQDAVDENVYNEIKDMTVGEFREWILADTTSTDMIRRISNGLTAEMIAGVTKLILCMRRRRFPSARIATIPSDRPAHFPLVINRIIRLIRPKVFVPKSMKAYPTARATRSSVLILLMTHTDRSRVCLI
jgi:hypothetical protein